MHFDENRLIVHKKTRFRPFQVSTFLDGRQLLDEQVVSPLDGVLLFEMKGQYYGLMTKQMTYHHVANGSIGDNPFMISF